MFSNELLKSRKILVTGGGTGLGLAMAHRFAELGAELVICGRRAEVLSAAVQQLRQDTGAQVTALPCDLRDSAAVSGMFDVLEAQGMPDVLVNNAAASFISRTEQLSAKAADAILNVTLHGTLYCTLEAGRRWIRRSQTGVVLSILSTSTRTGRAFAVPSAMAKSAVLAMTRSLAVEWGPKQIRCVAIAPGPFPTQGSQQGLDPMADRRMSSQAPLNPLGRVGQHLELANLATYLISEQASYINGEMVAIDGGQHLRTSGAEDLLTWTDGQWNQQRRR